MSNSESSDTSVSDDMALAADHERRQRSRRGFATVQLTMLSIVVALVLENLLGTLYDMPNWNLLVGLQSLDVLVTAFSMWVGFGFALTLIDKQPTLSDFLNPFFMLIFLSLAVRCMDTGNLAGFFLAGACGSLSSTINLWSEVRTARAQGDQGPTDIMYLLLASGVTELTAAAALWIQPEAVLIALAFLVLNISLQGATSAKSVLVWRRVTA